MAVVSPCHGSALLSSLADGVVVGSCPDCGDDLIRSNPRTGRVEWLDGASAWSPRDDLRPAHDPALHPALSFPCPSPITAPAPADPRPPEPEA